ncbi:TIR domain-containing protein [Pontixanthobacter sp.]|uniref:TIR domain-containing protein n=1 Tax=Pontixanthobacter sp. TaxID=2792078 RepID=UPI003C7CC690
MSGNLKEGAAPQSRFRAFLSYSHADQAAAQRLHRKLESYRLPRHLRGAVSNLTHDGRIGAIFRDREDLPAAQDLTASVKEALAASETLVVVCSPDAKASVWVAREIAFFRDIHPDRPILAALLRGDPEDAFPEPLLHGREPLAADLRKEGDGARLGFLKVVAGIAGVPLDALINRDAQRRVRRVTAITVAAIAAMIVMALMTTFAIQSRDQAVEAQMRAQAQAETTQQLNRFFVNDFRRSLLGHGRIDIAMEFYPKVLEYCTKQNLQNIGGQTGPANCAEIMQIMGADYVQSGDLKLARKFFNQSHRWTASQLAARPSNSRDLFNHAMSENRLGLLSVAEGARRQAIEEFTRARELLEQGGRSTRATRKWLQQIAYVHGNLGSNILQIGGDPKQALVHLRKATQANEQLLSVHPDNTWTLYDQSFQLQWLADALFRTGANRAARSATRQYFIINQKLVAGDPDNAQWQEQEMQLLVRHVEILDREGLDGDRQSLLARADAIARKLSAHDPGNAAWSNYAAKIATLKKEQI